MLKEIEEESRKYAMCMQAARRRAHPERAQAPPEPLASPSGRPRRAAALQAQHGRAGSSDDEDAAISDSDPDNSQGSPAPMRLTTAQPFPQRPSHRRDSHPRDGDRQADDISDEEPDRVGRRAGKDVGMGQPHRAGAQKPTLGSQADPARTSPSEGPLQGLMTGVTKRRRTNLVPLGHDESPEGGARVLKQPQARAGPQSRPPRHSRDASHRSHDPSSSPPHAPASAAKRAGTSVHATAYGKQQNAPAEHASILSGSQMKAGKATGGKGRISQPPRVMLRKKDLSMDLVGRQLEVNKSPWLSASFMTSSQRSILCHLVV